MKVIIIYGSQHQGNTERLVKGAVGDKNIDVLKAEDAKNLDLSAYDMIGFASGIDFGKFYPQIIEAAEKLPENKKVFAMFTCGSVNQKMGEQIRVIAEKKNCRFVGKYGCKGYDTYGPWKLIGGINKNHPNEQDIKRAAEFVEGILARNIGEE